MAFKDILSKRGAMERHRKQQQQKNGTEAPPIAEDKPMAPFTFIRTTTLEQEVIEPPSFEGDNDIPPARPQEPAKDIQQTPRSEKRRSFFRRSASPPSPQSDHSSHSFKRLSLRHRSPSRLPVYLQSPPSPTLAPATPTSAIPSDPRAETAWSLYTAQLLSTLSTPPSIPAPPTPADEALLHRAIAAHNAGSLSLAVELLRQLPHHPTAQILLALSLRHGWGVPPSPPDAVPLLLRAAAAPGPEQALALYELAQGYAHGWGGAADQKLARACYEAAANLGDADACGEVARCYLDGIGGGKDRGRAAGYLRIAQGLGRSGVGEGWVWKEKYDPPMGERERGR